MQSGNKLPSYQITQLPDLRAPRDVGRHGRLDLSFERRGGRTVVARQYAEPPWRIGSTFQAADVASLILVCAGPGIFAGDILRQSVHAESGTRVALTSQSALQVHPGAADAPARIAHTYHVAGDGELHCHWDPLIPFAGARVQQQFAIDVAEGGRLYWSDALMSGRASRGETWRFEQLAHELRLRVAGELVYLERFTLEPSTQHPPRRTAHLASGTTHPALATRHSPPGTHFSTTLLCHPRATPDAGESLQRSLDLAAEVLAGVDLIADGVLLARVVSASGAAFASAREAIRRFAAAAIFELPASAIRR